MRAGDCNAVDRTISRNIRQQRLRQQLSQTQLADAIGVTFQQIQKYETGANRISAARLFSIAHALGIPITTFFDGIDNTGAAAQAHLCAPLSLIAERQAAGVIGAYSRITDARMRARIAEFLDEIASSECKGLSRGGRSPPR